MSLILAKVDRDKWLSCWVKVGNFIAQLSDDPIKLLPPPPPTISLTSGISVKESVGTAHVLSL